MRDKKIIKTNEAPKAIGPYSVGVMVNNLVFTAGQLGIEPISGEIVAGGIQTETRQALKNIEKILIAAGSDISHVVKTTVFLRDMDDFSDMNMVYAEFFNQEFPSRTTVQVAALPYSYRRNHPYLVKIRLF